MRERTPVKMHLALVESAAGRGIAHSSALVIER